MQWHKVKLEILILFSLVTIASTLTNPPGNEISIDDLAVDSSSAEKSIPTLSATSANDPYAQAFPLLLPSDDHTKLDLQPDGLSVLRRLGDTPVVILMVIGPYRSGKSFLLNQLLGLPCNKGFGVGHQRAAMTKGIWVWGQPVQIEYQGETINVLYVDSEGFESTGQSDVYDDRIFALATLASSVLIYNLPETVKEADIEKLSFAVELAEEFYDRTQGRASRFQMPTLLWLIQRDFLEGRSVKTMVDDALAHVPNPTEDQHIERLNQIRESLQVLSKEYTAFGLSQPHLERTKLCDMQDSDFDPRYVQQKQELKHLIASLYRPKTVGGKMLTGNTFGAFLEQTVRALNARDIPTARSITEAFNKDMIQALVKTYRLQMESVNLPIPESKLIAEHQRNYNNVLQQFEHKRFGTNPLDTDNLLEECTLVLQHRQDANVRTSMEQCEAVYTACEAHLESLSLMSLPSTHKFKAGFELCNGTRPSRSAAVRAKAVVSQASSNTNPSGNPATQNNVDAFIKQADYYSKLTVSWIQDLKENLAGTDSDQPQVKPVRCVGPSLSNFQKRLIKLYKRESDRFLQDYNTKLMNGLSLAALVSVMACRFVFKSSTGEFLSWGLFLFLELYPKFFIFNGDMFDNSYWRTFIKIYEAFVYNNFFDLNNWIFHLLVVVCIFIAYKRVLPILRCCLCVQSVEEKRAADRAALLAAAAAAAHSNELLPQPAGGPQSRRRDPGECLGGSRMCSCLCSCLRLCGISKILGFRVIEDDKSL